VGWPRIKRSLLFGFKISMCGMSKDLKILAFLELFLEKQNHREKLILRGRNWIHCKKIFLKEE
jgi:hypothetical protein